uniref:Uncharacterized protein n=1 Tax=Lactuca sativa TaxID=4236 RepID=A0A9R1UNG5_LACSA|nr:hypothetical protein LSAT_V11C800390460 [Lactuca sativa]
MVFGNTIAAELHGEVGWPVFTFHVLHQITTLIEDYGMTRLENHLLTTVNQNILKEKTSSGMKGVNNEWCTLLHLLGCCLLSQAHLQSSWGLGVSLAKGKILTLENILKPSPNGPQVLTTEYECGEGLRRAIPFFTSNKHELIHIKALDTKSLYQITLTIYKVFIHTL